MLSILGVHGVAKLQLLKVIKLMEDGILQLYIRKKTLYSFDLNTFF